MSLFQRLMLLCWKLLFQLGLISERFICICLFRTDMAAVCFQRAEESNQRLKLPVLLLTVQLLLIVLRFFLTESSWGKINWHTSLTASHPIQATRSRRQSGQDWCPALKAHSKEHRVLNESRFEEVCYNQLLVIEMPKKPVVTRWDPGSRGTKVNKNIYFVNVCKIYLLHFIWCLKYCFYV